MPLPYWYGFPYGADASTKGFERRGVSLEVARLDETKYVNMPSLGSARLESGVQCPLV